jgi:hypothetical protein
MLPGTMEGYMGPWLASRGPHGQIGDRKDHEGLRGSKGTTGHHGIVGGLVRPWETMGSHGGLGEPRGVAKGCDEQLGAAGGHDRPQGVMSSDCI